MLVIGTRDGHEIRVDADGGIDVQVAEGQVERFEIANVERLMVTNALFGSASGYLTVDKEDGSGKEEIPVRVLRCVDPDTKVEIHLYYPEEAASRLAALVEGREFEIAKSMPALGPNGKPLH